MIDLLLLLLLLFEVSLYRLQNFIIYLKHFYVSIEILIALHNPVNKTREENNCFAHNRKWIEKQTVNWCDWHTSNTWNWALSQSSSKSRPIWEILNNCQQDTNVRIRIIKILMSSVFCCFLRNSFEIPSSTFRYSLFPSVLPFSFTFFTDDHWKIDESWQKTCTFVHIVCLKLLK